jgi:hypothetical protein
MDSQLLDRPQMLLEENGSQGHSNDRSVPAAAAGGQAPTEYEMRRMLDEWTERASGGCVASADPEHAKAHRALEAYTREMVPVGALDRAIRDVFVRVVTSMALHRAAAPGEAVRRLMDGEGLFDALLLAHAMWRATGAAPSENTGGYL